MSLLSSPRLAALQVLLRVVGVAPRSPRAAPSNRVSKPAVEVVSDYGVAPTFPAMR